MSDLTFTMWSRLLCSSPFMCFPSFSKPADFHGGTSDQATVLTRGCRLSGGDTSRLTAQRHITASPAPRRLWIYHSRPGSEGGRTPGTADGLHGFGKVKLHRAEQQPLISPSSENTGAEADMVELEKEVLPLPPRYRFRDLLLGDWQTDDSCPCSMASPPIIIQMKAVKSLRPALPCWVVSGKSDKHPSEQTRQTKSSERGSRGPIANSPERSERSRWWACRPDVTYYKNPAEYDVHVNPEGNRKLP
ncbi:KCNT2 protein, partial [Polypterus senegalus]